MENRYFQYIASERNGDVVIFDKIEQDDELTFVTFKDGSRCNEELIVPLNDTNWEGKLMAEISDSTNTWHFKEEWVGREEELWETNKDGESVCVQPFVAGRKKVTAIPPRKTTSKFGNPEQITIQPQIQNQIQPKVEPLINTTDPVYITLSKSKKTEINIELGLVLMSTSKELFNLIKENFECGEEKILNYIIENIKIDDIKLAIKNSLLKFYNGEEI